MPIGVANTKRRCCQSSAGGGGLSLYINEYGDVRPSNYMNSPSFHSSNYFSSPLNLQFRPFLRILFYMKRHCFRA